MKTRRFNKMLKHLTIGLLAVGSTSLGTIPAFAETPREYKEKATGFLAQALCSQRLNIHSSEYMEKKIQFYLDAYPEVDMAKYL